MDNKSWSVSIRRGSAILATIIAFLAIAFLPNSAVEKTWKLLSLFYVILLAVSGWLFAIYKWLVAGMVHAILMLGIAIFCLYNSLPFLLNPHDLADNAAAGVIVLVNLAVTACGVLTLGDGLAVISLIFHARSDKGSNGNLTES